MTDQSESLGRRAVRALDDLDVPVVDLGDPATDRPFTWRIHPDDRPLDLQARRVVRSTEPDTDGSDWPWLQVSGRLVNDWWLSHEEVRAWPYTTAEDAQAANPLAAAGEAHDGPEQSGPAPVVVARADGIPGCPERIWLDGRYPSRCGFGVDECHRHGPFAVESATS